MGWEVAAARAPDDPHEAKEPPTMARTRTRSATVAILTVLLMGLSTLIPSPASAGTLSPRARMYRATNTSRVNHSVRKVDIQWKLSKLARKHSVAMAQKGTIYHTANPERYYLKGIRWSSWGENVGVTGGRVWGLQQAFMDSPAHRANILDRGFQRVAVGTYRDAKGMLWVTVFFYSR
jgi:uncharacterized protein YkwD